MVSIAFLANDPQPIPVQELSNLPACSVDYLHRIYLRPDCLHPIQTPDKFTEPDV
jgi:hypothetical protein